MVVCLEWRAKICHFKKNNTKRPNIALFIITLLVALLRTHVEWATDVCFSKLTLTRNRLRKSEVSKLDVLLLVKEYIWWLNISVQYKLSILALFQIWLLLITPMTFKKRESRLHKYFPYEIFVYCLLFLFAFIDKLSEITTFTVLHDDIKCGVLFIYNLVKAAHNIFVLQLSQNINFVY